MAKDIKYLLKNGRFVFFNPNAKDTMSHKQLVENFGNKVVDISDLAKVLGIKKPSTRTKKEEATENEPKKS